MENYMVIINKLKDIFNENECMFDGGITILFSDTSPNPQYDPFKKQVRVSLSHNDKNLGLIVYQLAHEIVHAHTFYDGFIPRKISWINEFIAANISYYCLDVFARECVYLYNFEESKEQLLSRFPRIDKSQAAQIIKDNIELFEEKSDRVYGTPLGRFLYDIRNEFNIWNILKAFTKIMENKRVRSVIVADVHPDVHYAYYNYDILMMLSDMTTICSEISTNCSNDFKVFSSIFTGFEGTRGCPQE